MTTASGATGLDLRFRRVASGDTAAAQAAYRQIIDHLGQTVDYPRWYAENHPSPEAVRAWVHAGDLYFAVTPAPGNPAAEGRIVGVVALNHDAPAAYSNASWSIAAAGEEVLIVHGLGVLPNFLHCGVARFLIDATLDLGRKLGCLAVRLDTFVDNLPARELYARYGFTDHGCYSLHYEGTDLSEFHLFEHVLSS